mgnify:CR=1 FL=1
MGSWTHFGSLVHQSGLGIAVVLRLDPPTRPGLVPLPLGDCQAPLKRSDPSDPEQLCADCQVVDMAVAAMSRPVERDTAPVPPVPLTRQFGLGPGELPSSAIVQSIARRRESQTARVLAAWSVCVSVVGIGILLWHVVRVS